MEDDRVAILEAQLSQAKLIAEEADKKYEEVDTWWNIKSHLVRKKVRVDYKKLFSERSGAAGAVAEPEISSQLCSARF